MGAMMGKALVAYFSTHGTTTKVAKAVAEAAGADAVKVMRFRSNIHLPFRKKKNLPDSGYDADEDDGLSVAAALKLTEYLQQRGII